MGIWKNLGMGGYRGFSRPAARLLQQAVQLAGDLGCEQADTGHLLLAMLQQQGAAAQFLTRKNITEPEVRRQLAQRRSGPAQRLDRRAMAPDLRRTMDYALIGAQNAHVSRAEPEHLLCAMLEDDGCAAGLLLAEMGLPLTEAVRECRQLSGQFVLPAQPRVSASIPRGSRASDKYCRDLTRRAAEGELDPVFCREAELDRMVEILCRRQKNDPCLIGEPGVGKTALAEGLALRIAAGQVPRALQGRRLLALDMVYGAASGHIGGSLSSLDILTTLYFHVMRVSPDAPQAPERDRFVLSKGHCTPALYSTMAQRGFFPLEELKQFRRIDGHMSGHAEMRHVKGVDMSTGSLGQGISVAVGMALAGKADGRDYRVYALLGDGEIEEGQVWEAAMAAAKYRLDNLCAVVDVNGLQIDGATADVLPSEPLDQKFEAFNWNVIRVDGHDYAALAEAFAAAAACKGKPTVLLARTVKGKGVSFMEGDYGWHGKAPNAEQYEKARAELSARVAELEGK